ncbi:MAG: hypothetical protein ACYDIC_00380 [Desulfobaccales bacterium]
MPRTVLFNSFLLVAFLLSFLLSGLVSPSASEELTPDKLKNRQYFIPSWENPDQGEWVQLQDGGYHRDHPNDFLEVRMVASATGYLSNNKTKDGAVIYGFSQGGTGFFVMLCAVLNDQGVLTNSNLVDLEDRVKINSLSIKSGEIIVDMLAHRPSDPAPLPTLKKIAKYHLVGNKLEEIGKKTD